MSDNIENLFEQLHTGLQTAEKRHRTIRDSASDSSDWGEYDRQSELISKIISWRRNLETICTQIVSSGADIDLYSSPVEIFENQNLSENTEIPIKEEVSFDIDMPVDVDESIEAKADVKYEDVSCDEDLKIGKYIQEKLRELENNFIFTKEQVLFMCDVGWSKDTFSYNRALPFAKIADLNEDISIQIKDENGHNRYWNKVYWFGGIPLLIISQWYEKDRIRFDNWYDNLIQKQVIGEKITPSFDCESEKSIIIHAKKKRFDEYNIVEVSTSYVPILSFINQNMIIAAKLLDKTMEVSFRVEAYGVMYPQKIGMRF